MKNSINILIVEDEEQHARLLTRNLNKHSLVNQIHHVKNGEQTIEYLIHQKGVNHLPDLIILDLKLPKLSGHEVLEIIKSNEDLKTIPIIILSTSKTQNDRNRAYQNYANSYLVKPLDYEQFKSMVNDLCNYWAKWNN